MITITIVKFVWISGYGKKGLIIQPLRQSSSLLDTLYNHVVLGKMVCYFILFIFLFFTQILSSLTIAQILGL